MGFLDSFSSLASTASPLTNLIPGGGVFNAAVSIGSKLGNFLSGKGGVPDHERPDIVSISNQTGLTQQQVSDLCGMEESRSPANYDDIVKKYAGNPSGLLPLIDEWNGKNPSRKIVSLDSITPSYPQSVPATVYQAPASLTAATVPAVVMQSLTSSAAPSNAIDIKGLGGAILTGAQNGATDWAMATPAGIQAKNQGAISWAKDNMLYFVLGAVALGALIFKAFKK